MTFAGAALLLAVLGTFPMAGREVPRPAAAVAVHNTHLSTLRLVVEGTTISGRVRLFRDDLEAALRKFPRAQALTLKEGALADSLVNLYVGRTLALAADGTPVPLHVTSSGIERDALSKQDVAWYILEAEVKAPPRAVTILDRMLCEEFDDQQNIVTLLALPQDRRTTLYFTTGDQKAQTLRW